MNLHIELGVYSLSVLSGPVDPDGFYAEFFASQTLRGLKPVQISAESISELALKIELLVQLCGANVFAVSGLPLREEGFARQLRILAKEMDVHVMAETRTSRDRLPALTDVLGAAKNSASLVVALHESQRAVLKNRFGPRAFVS